MPTHIPESLPNHPQLDDNCPTAGLENTGLRRTRKNKIKIPRDSLDRHVGKCLADPGVHARVLDNVAAEEGELTRESLAAESELNTFQRQVEMTGTSHIKNQREQWLDSKAVSLLCRAFPTLCHDDEDRIHAGFRSGDCTPNQPGVRDAFVLRLVHLQFIIRRGIEIRETMDQQSGETRFPLVVHDVEQWNQFRPEDHTPAAGPPGTVIKQPLSLKAQGSAKTIRKRRRDPTDDIDLGSQAAEVARLKEALDAEKQTVKDYERDSSRHHKGTPAFPDLDNLPPPGPPAAPRRARRSPTKTSTRPWSQWKLTPPTRSAP